MGTRGFEGNVQLPDSNGVKWAAHHAISFDVIEKSDFFSALKSAGLFNGASFADDGVPLPRTNAGAAITDMSRHIDGHPAYINWQRGLFLQLACKNGDSHQFRYECVGASADQSYV